MPSDDFDFDAAMLRLKGALKVRTDKEVAQRLGMSATALNDRKKRNSFPNDKVRALASKELFDADYVITGLAATTLELIHSAKAGRPMLPATHEEHHVLKLWRSCSTTDKAFVLGLLTRLSSA